MIVTAAIFIIGILIALVSVTFLVTIHEFGHFLTAKLFGVRVEEFGIGFPIPRRAWGRKIGETIYSLNWLPAGGFVRLFGEDEAKDDPASFSSKPAWQRAVIIAAGVFVNLIFAFLLFGLILAFSGWKTEIPMVFQENKFPFGHQENQEIVTFVEKDSPAEKATIASGDKILSINGVKIDDPKQLRVQINSTNGGELSFEVENSTEQVRTVNVSPKYNTQSKFWQIGIDFTQVALLSYPSLGEKILVGPLHSVNMLQYQYSVIKSLFGKSIAEGNVEPVRQNVSGIVGIVGIFVLLVQSFGFGAVVPVLTIMALLSLLLAVINILPIPAVDGGRLFFVLVELFTRRKVNATVERWIHAIGFGVLIILFLLITANDVLKFFH